MTLTEIYKNIENLAKAGGLPSDDSRLGSRLIKFWIRYYRSALLPKYTEFGKDISPELVQDLGCLALTDVDKSECPEVPAGCTVKKVEIPGLVDLPSNRGLIWIGLVDKVTPITIAHADSIYWTRYRRITNNMTRAYMIGNTIYVITGNERRLKYINVRGVFEDPVAVDKTDADGNAVCFDEKNDKYPIMDAMVAEMVEQILQKEMRVSVTTKMDVKNDSLDGVSPREE